MTESASTRSFTIVGWLGQRFEASLWLAGWLACGNGMAARARARAHSLFPTAALPGLGAFHNRAEHGLRMCVEYVMGDVFPVH